MRHDEPKIEASDKPYEAPRVEQVVTPEALAREIQYAGTNSLVAQPGD